MTKAPHRTVRRILETALGLFNRFGEPNVSIATLTAELGMSPGNLYYHFASKEDILSALVQEYRQSLGPTFAAAAAVQNAEDAWLFFHSLFESVWQYRFLYRDLNDLLSKSRPLELTFQDVFRGKTRAVQELFAALRRAGILVFAPEEMVPVATAISVLLTYWLSHESAREPRRMLDWKYATQAFLRGAAQVLSLLLPYLQPEASVQWRALIAQYVSAEAPESLDSPAPSAASA